LKSRLIVTIYGPYTKRYAHLQKIVSNNQTIGGYTDTQIVMERDDLEIVHNESQSGYAVRKSLHYLRESHVNILIFYPDDNNEGVAIELARLNDIPNKVNCSYLLLPKTPPVSSLVKGLYDDIRCDYYEFNFDDDDALASEIGQYIYGVCTSFLLEKVM
jgi:hypothetical protein